MYGLLDKIIIASVNIRTYIKIDLVYAVIRIPSDLPITQTGALHIGSSGLDLSWVDWLVHPLSVVQTRPGDTRFRRHWPELKPN